MARRVVEIEWEDAAFVLDGDFKEYRDSLTVGYFISANPSYYEICMEYDAFGNPEGIQRIPTGIVKRVTDLVEES